MSSIQTSDEIGNSNSDTSRRRSIRCVTVEPVVVLVSIAVGMTIPLTQQYIYKRMMEEYAPGVVFNHSTCKTSANATILVEQHSSKWMMLLTLSFMIPTFFSSLILGSISDKYGRKFTLLLPIIGSSFKQLITVLVVGFNLRIEYLFIGNIVDGLCGGASIILMSCFAYISDITLPDRRMLRYVIVECSASLGVIVSSIGTGYLINYTGFLWPNVIAIFLISLNAVYSMTLQETVAKQNSNVATFGFGYLLEPLKLYVKNDEHGRRWKLAIIMAIFVLVNMADFGRIDCEALHLLSYPFCWSSIILGYYSATAKTAGMITALILAKLVSRWIGGLDLVLIVIACLSGAAYEIVFPLIKQMSILFSITIVGSAINLAYPVARTFMSKMVQPDEQGKLLATVAWVQLVSITLGSMTFNTLYMSVVDKNENIAFFSLAGVFALGSLFSLGLLIGVRRSSSRYELLTTVVADQEA